MSSKKSIPGRGKVPHESNIFLGKLMDDFRKLSLQIIIANSPFYLITLCKSFDLIVLLPPISASLFSDILPYEEAEIRKLRTIYLRTSQALST